MKIPASLIIGTSVGIFFNSAFADIGLSYVKQGIPYTDIKVTLINKGWKPVKNQRIDYSSLYAQDIYGQGMEEVVDCISMEIDACVFRYSKKNQVLEIKTITKRLIVDSFKTKKR